MRYPRRFFTATLSKKFLFLGAWLWLPIVFSSSNAAAQAVYVSNLQATYRHGQVFLTWTCPSGTGYKYKIYRSTSILDNKSKITSAVYLGGYVMDSSSLNVRLTRQLGVKTYFSIEDGGPPLSANTGLYVVTCDAPGSYYYAVTVTRLSNGKEYSKMTVGSNTLAAPVVETVADPQPIFQSTFVSGSTGETIYRYVQFGDHRNLPHYPYMFSQGSYGFNFNIVYRGNYVGGPLYVFYEGLKGDAFVGKGLSEFANITNCILISVDDWLPVPNGYGTSAGINTFWTGYHENFNPYLLSNPIPTSGTVRMYHQHRYIHTIKWASKYLPIDSNRIHLVGVSSGGYGVLVTACIIPEKIASVYSVLSPVIIKSTSIDPDTLDESLWGTNNPKLNCDIIDRTTGLPFVTFDLMNIKTMVQRYATIGLPPIYTIHGKNDVTVGWSDKPDYLNKNDANWQGGVHFWDQRQHNGNGSNFFDSETTPPFAKFFKNKSFPAISNCDLNENPGNGNPNDGAPYGSYSGFVTYDSVTENSCKWTGYLKMANFTVGGVAQSSATSCFADVTLRRCQHFKPTGGVTIKWANYDKDNVKIQSGSFVYNAGAQITIGGVKMKKSGNRLEVEIKNCTLKEEPLAPADDKEQATFHLVQTMAGWELSYTATKEERMEIRVFDMLGRLLFVEPFTVYPGTNTRALAAPGPGAYLIQLEGADSRLERKVIY